MSASFLVGLLVGGLVVWLAITNIIRDKRDQLKQIIKTLTRQASRYALAAQQDQQPLISLLHAYYAAAYIFAVADIATPEQVHTATNQDLLQVKSLIEQTQDQVTKRVAARFPGLEPPGGLLARLAEE